MSPGSPGMDWAMCWRTGLEKFAALQTSSNREICKVYRTKIHKFKGARWRYKLTVSAKCTIQKRTKIQRWTLALQTYRVLQSLAYKDT